MTDRLLGVMALVIGGALAWFLFEPVMSATAAHGVSVDAMRGRGRHDRLEQEPCQRAANCQGHDA